MRGCLPGMLLLAACYAPAIPTDVACSPMRECPEGQSCQSGVCKVGEPVVPLDQDMDGVADDKDNCPTVVNADQGNEDGDKFGDKCDPCPQFSDVAVADDDGDQIGNACDPNAGMTDALWLFEGFHTGMPAWPVSVNWVSADDKARVTAAGNPSLNDEFLVPPFTLANRTYDNYAVTMSVVVDQLSTGTEHEIALEMTDSDAKANVDCEIAEFDGNHILWLVDDINLDQKRAFAWTSGAEYTLRMTRHGMMYTCDVTGPGGPVSATGMSTLAPRKGTDTLIWAYGVTAQVAWITVIGPAP